MPAGRSTRTRTVWVRASAAGSTVTAAASTMRLLAGSSTLARSGPAPSSARRCGARSATARICAGSYTVSRLRPGCAISPGSMWRAATRPSSGDTTLV